MKPVLRYVIFGLVIYGVFVLGMVPASWVYSHGLQSRLGGVALYGVQGTVWQGRASLLTSRGTQLQNLQWDLHPWALLWGRMEAALRFDYQAAPGKTVVGRTVTGNWYLRDADLALPAQRLAPLLRMPGAELGGKLALRLSSLTVKQGRVTAADGELSWEKAALRKPLEVELGTFAVNLETTADGVSGALMDRGGAVQAQGLLKLQANGQYQLTATFASRNPQQPLITQGLRLFGTPGPDGRVKYSTKGVLPPLFPGAG